MQDSQPDNVLVKAPDNIEAQPFSVGAALREARTRSGMSVDDVCNRIKFAPRQIEALEADDFARLPEIAFVRGFVRSYARLLQLDPAPLLAALPGKSTQPAPFAANAMAEVPFQSIYSVRKLNIVWLAAALAVAVALALFILLHDDTPQKEAVVQSTVAPASAVLAPIPPASAVAAASQVVAPISQQAAAPQAKTAAVPQSKTASAPPAKPADATGAPKRAGAIRMAFDDESWVEVTDKDGKILMSQVNPRGSEQEVNGQPPFSVVIGRAKGVRLFYKGRAVDLEPHTHSEVARLKLE